MAQPPFAYEGSTNLHYYNIIMHIYEHHVTNREEQRTFFEYFFLEKIKYRGCVQNAQEKRKNIAKILSGKRKIIFVEHIDKQNEIVYNGRA